MVSVLLIPLIPAPLFSTSPENKRTSPFIPFSTVSFELLLYFIFLLLRLFVRLSVAGCGRQIIGKAIFVELGACIGESRRKFFKIKTLLWIKETQSGDR